MNKPETEEWIIRGLLSCAYESSGQYEKALEQIGWQIVEGPRQKEALS